MSADGTQSSEAAGLAAPASTSGGATTLDSSALNLSQVAVLGIAYMGLALSMYFVLPLALQANGPNITYVVIATAAALAPTAASFVVLCRRYPSAGSAYTWLWRAGHPRTGVWLGWVLLGTYGVASLMAQPLILGQTFNAFLQYLGIGSSFGTAVIGAIGLTLVVALLLAFNLQLSKHAIIGLFAFETAFVLILITVIIITQAVHGHLSAVPLLPSGIQHGSAGFKEALIFAIFAMAAVDTPATVAEESKSPRKIIPRATVLILLLGTAFFVLASYALGIAEPPARLASFINSASQAGPMYAIAGDYIGGFKLLVVLTSATAILAVFVAAMVFAARITYALARDGLLPSWFGELHPTYRTPRRAQLFWVGLGLVLPILLALWQGHSFEAGYAWGGALFAGFVLVAYVAVNLTHMRLAWNERDRVSFGWFANGVVPLVGVGVSGWLLFESFIQPFSQGAFKTSGSILLAWALWLVFGAGAAVVSWRLRAKRLGSPSPVTVQAHALSELAEAPLTAEA